MIKDICVHLDGNVEDEARLAIAEQIAEHFDAFLAGVLVNPLPAIRAMGGFGYNGLGLDELQHSARARGDEAMRHLRTRFDALPMRHELRRHDVEDARCSEIFVQEARLFDLFVGTRPYGHEDNLADVIEAVLFRSGRASLLVPPGAIKSFDPDTIVVAWSNTRESARAVSEAMPFLVRAKAVSVCMVGNEDKGGIERAAQGSDIARHLDRHGVKVQLNPVPHGKGVSDTLLEEATLAGAGLLVMGAYGHSRFREWMLGGATRGVLTRATLPVLIAH
ncbi:universal stress protein [Pelagibacterium montanilacus]|uniref:universal stress protein n=1 Tax=Pelagibacterium montanilacus TaxID=2185280 RepID=UPI0013E0DF86|nr:universal stress protein [Pelagibacterium montanilacus]